VADEVVEGVVDGARVVVGLGQAVEVVQDVGAAGVEVEIELASAAELEEVQADTPPAQKAGLVSDRVLVPGIREPVEPLVKVGEEVAGGEGEGAAGDQGCPALRRRCVTWVRTRAMRARTREAARMGVCVASFLRRASRQRRMRVGWSGMRMGP